MSKTLRRAMTRPQTVGPDNGPESPFPLKARGEIVKGFGRGSKELGIPTANIPVEGVEIGGEKDLESGIYYGWAGLSLDYLSPETAEAAGFPNPKVNQKDLLHSLEDTLESTVHALMGKTSDPYGETEINVTKQGQHYAIYPMVMSIGWNPYYKNEKRSVEVHLLHKFSVDFYGSPLNLSILGFIRPERDYDSKEALIEDIKMDMTVSSNCLARHAYAELAKDPYLSDFSWARKKESSQ